MARADADPRASRWGHEEIETVPKKVLCPLFPRDCRGKKKKHEGRCNDKRDLATLSRCGRHGQAELLTQGLWLELVFDVTREQR